MHTSMITNISFNLFQPAEKKMKKHKKGRKDQTDNFDQLVNKYKQKLSSNKDGSAKKSKWFSEWCCVNKKKM